jgi:hypothetical protein
MVVAPSPELASTLRNLAGQLGYALRKARPKLSSSHQTRLLSPICEVLDDLRAELHAGNLDQVSANAPYHVKEEMQLLAKLAAPSFDNRVKHDVDVTVEHFTPMPPMPDTAVICDDFEQFMLTLYRNSGAQYTNCLQSNSGEAGGLLCSFCGVWQPLPELGQRRVEYIPSSADVITLPSSSGDHEEQVDEASVSDVGAPLRAMHCVTIDVATAQCQALSTPVNQSPQMPRLEFSTIRDIGAAVACSWDLTLLLQPYLALVVELGGGSVSTFTP